MPWSSAPIGIGDAFRFTFLTKLFYQELGFFIEYVIL